MVKRGRPSKNYDIEPGTQRPRSYWDEKRERLIFASKLKDKHATEVAVDTLISAMMLRDGLIDKIYDGSFNTEQSRTLPSLIGQIRKLMDSLGLLEERPEEDEDL